MGFGGRQGRAQGFEKLCRDAEAVVMAAVVLVALQGGRRVKSAGKAYD